MFTFDVHSFKHNQVVYCLCMFIKRKLLQDQNISMIFATLFIKPFFSQGFKYENGNRWIIFTLALPDIRKTIAIYIYKSD